MQAKSTPPDLTPAVIERAWSYVRRGPDCWEWAGGHIPEGYGSFSVPGRNQEGAHRIIYYIVMGEWPPLLDHLCRNRGCVNPAHLDSTDDAGNLHRGNPIWKQLAARTHCPRGHEFTPENTYQTQRGRKCRQCRRETRPPRACCKRGHEFTPETMRVYPSGYRICLICRPEL